MMNILVCAKVAPDLEMLSDEDWQPEGLSVETRFARLEWNCFDESALEMALRCSDSLGGKGTLTALTIGKRESTSLLQTLLALDFDRVVRIDPGEADLRFSPLSVARLIEEFIYANPQDLVFLGSSGSVGDNGQTPLILCELLHIPCVTLVSEIALEKSTLTIRSSVDNGFMEQCITPPVILSIGNAETAHLRVPTLKDRMTKGKREIEVLERSNTVAGQECVLEALVPVEMKRSGGGEIISGASPEQMAKTLYEAYLKESLRRS